MVQLVLPSAATSPFDLAASDACERLATRSTPNQATSVGIAMVRNQQDIIERFVRHNLRYLGKLVVIDHGSIDDTPRILRCLRDEGLPLEFFVDEDLGLHQADRLTRLARKAARLLGAHPLVPLDADEFLVSPSGDDIPTLLKEMHAGEAKVILWRTYVPTATDPAEEQDIFKRITNRSSYEPSITKVIIGGGLAKREDFRIGNGSHEIVLGSERVINQVDENRILLAHFPIRSAGQLAAKVTQQRLAIAVTRNAHPGKGEHYKQLDLAVPISDSMTPAELQKAALMFCCPQGTKGGALIKDPLPARDALRYLPRGEINFLDIVEAFARDLARLAEAVDEDSSLVESLAMKENMELRKFGATLENKLTEGLQELSRANFEIRRLKRESAVRARALRAMRRSSSWRVTAPLRQIRLLLTSLSPKRR